MICLSGVGPYSNEPYEISILLSKKSGKKQGTFATRFFRNCQRQASGILLLDSKPGSHGLPCVTGLNHYLTLIRTGDLLVVDGYRGIVSRQDSGMN